jgi:hypothetical protein
LGIVALDLEEDFIVVVGYFDVQMFALSCSAACVSLELGWQPCNHSSANMMAAIGWTSTKCLTEHNLFE